MDRKGPPFEDRPDAARQLAAALQRFKGARPLVLAIPHAAIPMAEAIAAALDGEAGVVLVRKLGDGDSCAVRRPDPAGRTVIVIDDGLATGASMCTALQQIRACAPARLVCAVPVALAAALQHVVPAADEVVCLSVRESMGSVNAAYRR
jgi:putative phosphoribosyl transferase